MRKMGLFGGTFDPIHQGHVTMARRLCDRLGLDGMILMPACVPPHKIREQMASADDRLEMCRLAVGEDPRLQVSELEIRREGASFTADTLDALTAEYPDTRWYLIVGADMFCTLRTWYRFADIARMATLCTIPRAGVPDDRLREYAAALEADGIACVVDPEPVEDISSTEIRRRASNGEPLHGLVPAPVEAYIAEHGLYREPQSMEAHSRDEQFRQIIRARLGDYRYEHSLCVAREAARLAEKYGADKEKAYTAGLLHDIMKDTDQKTQLQILADFDILLDDVTRHSPKLWHPVTGAAFLERVLKVDDPEILTAVRYHTTGRAGMSLLERVLFVADFTSADRTYEDVDVMRRLAEQSLEAAMEYGIAYTIRELLDGGRTVHPDTLAAYNEVVLQRSEGGLTHETE